MFSASAAIARRAASSYSSTILTSSSYGIRIAAAASQQTPLYSNAPVSRAPFSSSNSSSSSSIKSSLSKRAAQALNKHYDPSKSPAQSEPAESTKSTGTTTTPPPDNEAATATATTPVIPPSTTTTKKSLYTNPNKLHEFAPRIVVVGVGGAGGNAVNNMIARSLTGVDFLALNTDAQHLSTTLTDNRLQIGSEITNGLGCGANPDAGRLAAEESSEEIMKLIGDAHMVFITCGMGGGTGTGAAPVVADLCYSAGVLTVGVVTKPFMFEGTHRMRLAKEGIEKMESVVDTMLVIPNQNLFNLVDQKTTFIDSFKIADDVLLAGVRGITDLMTSPGLINLDFADVQSVMHGMGNAMLGTGQATGEDRAVIAAEEALTNPLLGDMDISTAKGMLVNITGGNDMTLFEVDQAAQMITKAVTEPNANIIFGTAFDDTLDGHIKVSLVATGIEELDIDEEGRDVPTSRDSSRSSRR